jgi:hypothetical protein
VHASEQRHGVEPLPSGIWPDALSDATKIESIRDILLLQNSVTGGVSVNTLLSSATDALRNKLSSRFDVSSSTAKSGTPPAFTTARAFKESDAHVFWLGSGLQVSADIVEAAKAGSWTTVLALLGEFDESVLVHDNLEAYSHIYPFSDVRISAVLCGLLLILP